MHDPQQRREQRKEHDHQFLLRKRAAGAVAVLRQVDVMPRVGVAVKLPLHGLGQPHAGVVCLRRMAEHQLQYAHKQQPGQRRHGLAATGWLTANSHSIRHLRPQRAHHAAPHTNSAAAKAGSTSFAAVSIRPTSFAYQKGPVFPPGRIVFTYWSLSSGCSSSVPSSSMSKEALQ